MAIADGACAARSRREEEDDALPSSTTTNEVIARNPRLPNGLRARVRTQTLSCADEHLRYIQFDLWAQQLSCYFGIDHLVPSPSDTGRLQFRLLEVLPYVRKSEVRVSICDSALMFGDMAFEVTRTFQEKPFRLRHHMERLYGSLRLLEIDSGLSLEEMEELTFQTRAESIH